MELTLENYKFFYFVRPKLNNLSLGKLSTQFVHFDAIDRFLQTENITTNKINRFTSPSTLNLSFLEDFGDHSKLMEYFVFGEVFKWDDVTITGFNPISLIDTIPFTDCCQNSDQYRHLRYLKIDGIKIFSSLCGISTNSLKIIGD